MSDIAPDNNKRSDVWEATQAIGKHVPVIIHWGEAGKFELGDFVVYGLRFPGCPDRSTGTICLIEFHGMEEQ